MVDSKAIKTNNFITLLLRINFSDVRVIKWDKNLTERILMNKEYKDLADAVIRSALSKDINYLWTDDGKFWSKFS